jgi:hypothetical protein
MSKKIVFIGGLHRSGTSLLQFLLGAHPGYAAVGEVYGLVRSGSRYLHRAAEVGCSCGVNADQCAFWGPLVPQLRRATQASDAERYGMFLRHFAMFFGNGAIPVDSSKDLGALRMLHALPHIEVEALFSIRDVRAWTVSVQRAEQGRQGAWGAARAFWRWYRGNGRYMAALQHIGLRWLTVSHEELVLRPEPSLSRIMAFLGDSVRGDMLNFNQAGHHAVLVNRMKSNREKMNHLRYDHRWFYRSGQWMLPALLLPNIMRFNHAQVYGHAGNVFEEPVRARLSEGTSLTGQ